MASALDISKLPPPAAVEPLSFDAIVADIKADLIARLPALEAVLSFASEPVVQLIEAFAYRELLLRDRVNQGYKAATLAFAVGPDLDIAAANLGVARLPGEEDEVFRSRAVLAADGWSVAGPRRAYEFHARSASPLVSAVAVTSPEPGHIRVVVLSNADDGVADAALLDTVANALNHEDLRPFDQVSVVSANISTFNVRARLKIPPGPDTAPVLEAAENAIRTYAGKRRRLGLGVVRNAISAALMQPGVEDVVILEPLADIPGILDTAPVLAIVDLEIEVMA